MKTPATHLFSPRFRKLVYWTIGLVLFYTIVGFLILPPIIRSVAQKRLSQELGRTVTIEKVKLNPYALSTTIRGLLIKDKDGEPFVSWDEVYVNLELSSFFGHAWVFKEISTSNPYVRVQVNKDYTLNFSDLVDKYSKPSTTPAPAKPAKPLSLRVELLKISGAKASVADMTTRQPFKRTIGPVEVTLTQFYTDPSNKNPYSFVGTTDVGEKFGWAGYFYLDPIRSEGEVTLDNVSLDKYAPLYQDFVRFDIRDGIISLRSTYNLVKSATTNVFAVTNTTFRLESLKVGEKGNPENIIDLPQLSVVGASADALHRTAEVNSILVKDARLVLRRDKNDAVNILEVAKPVDNATNAPGGILFLLQSVTNAFAMLLNSTNAASGVLHDITVTNCSLHLEDLANARPAHLDLDQIALDAKELSNIAGKDMTADLSLRWETNGTIHTTVNAGLTPEHADVKLALDNVALRPLDPYLEPHVNIYIMRSKLGMDGAIHLVRTNEALPEVTFKGDVRLNDFSTVDGVLGEDFVKWSSVRVNGIDANLNPPAVAIKQIAVDDAYAHLLIETNRTINILTALHIDTTKTNAASVAKQPEPTKKHGKKQITMFSNAERSLTNATAVSIPAKISVGSIVLSNANLQFTDRSIQPPVNAAIGQVNGNISGISTEDLQRADLHLTGKVDNTAPVEITGKLNPLNQKLPTELSILFKDIDLHPTGSYSVKFLGYRLNKGKLSLDLRYSLADRKLKSTNVIIVDQLMLGEKIPGPDATKLPIKLAVAVLKDRNGKIELDVPIDGSIDDPNFHLGKVISRAIVNVLTKIVTSPFAALGAVFGGKGEEISFQDFEPGHSELLPASAEKLDALVKGLYERPGLQLEIEGSIDPKTDLAGLRRQKLEKRFRLAKWNSLRKSDQTETRPESIQLTPEERATYLKQAYGTALTAGLISTNGVAVTDRTSQPTVVRTVSTGDAKGATRLVKNSFDNIRVPANDMESQLLETIQVSTDDFQTLANDRAQRVKEYILKSGKVEAARVFLTQSGSSATSNKGSRVYLHLQ